MDPEVRQLLERVDEFYDSPEKWCQDRPMSGSARCLYFACHTFANEMFIYRHLMIRDLAFHEMGFRSFSFVVDYNDESGRTFADIKRRLATTLQKKLTRSSPDEL